MSPTTALSEVELRWSVIAVEYDDVLNVREAPAADAPAVAELAPWQSGFEPTGAVERTPEGATWREIRLIDGVTGWVNSRFVIAQPANLTPADEAAMEAKAAELLAWFRQERSTPPDVFADRAVWAAGLGIYADAGSLWNWVPASELADPEAWREPREFGIGFECGDDCRVPLTQLLLTDELGGETQVALNDRVEGNGSGFFEGKLWEAPASLNRVVLIEPPTTFVDDNGEENVNLDWQRIHLVFHWEGSAVAEPRIVLISSHGWTP